MKYIVGHCGNNPVMGYDPAGEWVHLTVNGEKITCTPEHPFYTPVKGWTEACDLRAGDILVTLNGDYVILEEIQHEILEKPETTYNFEVTDFHTYFVGSAEVLVHNDCTGDWDDAYEMSRVGRQHGKAPRSNAKQNSQFDYVVKSLKLTKKEAQELHYAITKQGFGLDEMIELAKSMFGK